MLRKQLISFANRLGIYHRLRSSSIFDLYLRFVNKTLIEERDQEVDFYRGVLKGIERGGLIFDIGANVGDKTEVFLRIGARVVAVEPDERNQAILRQRFLRYRLMAKPITIVCKAAGANEGSETMWIDSPGSALNTLSHKWADALRGEKKRYEQFSDRLEFGQSKLVETVTLDRLIDVYGLPCFVKIDVEGFELNVLQGLHRRVPHLSFEVNLPEFRQEGLQCIELLGELAPRGQFNYTGDCRKGFALEKWLDRVPFSEVFHGCDEKCVEVFWRTPSESTRSL